MSASTEAPEQTQQVSPVNDLVNLLITMLTPMFIAAAGGDLRLARLGAQQMLLAYKAHNHADWLTIAQVVALGLATLNTLCLSFAETLPVSLVVRLNNSADRLNRAEGRQRKLLAESASKPQTETSLPLARQPVPPKLEQSVSEPDPATAAPAPQPQTAAELGHSIALLQEAQTLFAACEAVQAAQPITTHQSVPASVAVPSDAARMIEQLLADSTALDPKEATAALAEAGSLLRTAHDLAAQMPVGSLRQRQPA